jgi:hypothetical protein
MNVGVRNMPTDKKPEPVNTVVSPEKLAAWLRCREIWKASGKPPHVTPALLEAEEDAKNTQ